MQNILKYSLCIQMIILCIGYGGNLVYIWGVVSILAVLNLIIVASNFKYFSAEHRYINILIWLFFLSLLLPFLANESTVVSQQFTRTPLAKIYIYQWIIPVSAMIVIPQVIDTKKDFMWFIRILLCMILLQVVVGVCQTFVSRKSFLYSIYPFFGSKLGITGTYITRNLYANILVAGTPLLLSLLFKHLLHKPQKFIAFTRNSFYIYFYSLCCIFVAICVILSKSRTGIFLYFCCIFFWLWINEKRVLLLLLFIITFAILVVSGPSILERFSSSGDDFGYRWSHYTTGTKIIGDHWLFGCGPGNFTLFFEVYRDIPVKIQYFHLDNDYIEFIAEYGIFPSFFGLMFLVYWCYLVIPRVIHCQEIVLHGCLLSVIIFFIFAALHFSLHVNAHRLFLAWIMGILVRYSVKVID